MIKNNYAKINLALNVTNKTKPKYLHDLDMINITIRLKDTLSISFVNDSKNEIHFICNNSKVPADESNTIYKVIRKFQKSFNKSFSCNIKLNKKIPLEAGLAGGSGNAVAALEILDRKFMTNMTMGQMMKFIEPITSDGPFMVYEKPARVKGVSNQIKPINSQLDGKLFVVKPFSGCSTKEVYGHLDYANLTHPNMNKVQEALETGNMDLLKQHLGNSLLESATSLNDEIKDILQRMRVCGFEIVSMTGSGSTCFAYSNSKLPYKLAKKIFDKQKYELCSNYTIKK